MNIKIRQMRQEDLERLSQLSPEAEGQAPGSASHKELIDFIVYPTIVAVAPWSVGERMVANGEISQLALSSDGLVVGYAQFTFTADKIFHSRSIRVSRKFKNQGIGAMLCAERVRLARAAGSMFHLYIIAADGEEALKKIVIAQGMHLCCKFPGVWLYAQDLHEEEDPGYDEPEWHEERHGPHDEVISGGI